MARQVARRDGWDWLVGRGEWIPFRCDPGVLVRQVMRVCRSGAGLAPVTSGRMHSWLPPAYAPRP